MGRIIGIVHRRKKTAAGEARPTLVCIQDGSDRKNLELADETAELDFILNRLPEKHRPANEGEDLSQFRPHHRKENKKTGVISVPESYVGLAPGDSVVMCLGGSGDRLAYAICKQGISVWRIPPFTLKDWRDKNSSKDEDAEFLVEMFGSMPDLFGPTSTRDLELIKLVEAYRSWQEAMKARIGCELRLHQRLVGQIFLLPDGGYPEGLIEDEYDKAKASDSILDGLVAEEAKRLKELTKLIKDFPLYRDILSGVEGCGISIAARIISSIGDVRRFPTEAKFLAFCGLHCLPDGRFARKRTGEVANWSNEARQGFYLLGDQMNRRPNSVWGQKLLERKAALKVLHPEPVEEVKNGKQVKKYTPGHIHKMALWRVQTRFGRWLYRAWMALEKQN